MGATVLVNPDGTFDYDPTAATAIQALDDGDSAADTFTYTITDSHGATSTATVTIMLTGIDDPGDFDGDGDHDCDDIDALVVEIVSGLDNPAFDLTGDALLISPIEMRGWPSRAPRICRLATRIC